LGPGLAVGPVVLKLTIERSCTLQATITVALDQKNGFCKSTNGRFSFFPKVGLRIPYLEVPFPGHKVNLDALVYIKVKMTDTI